MKVVIVNGLPRAGKDQFVEFCKENLPQDCCCAYSSIDYVKEVARGLGWDGEKTPKNRRFLSDLKDALTRWNDIPMCKMADEMRRFQNETPTPEDSFFFVMIREPEEIEKAAKAFNAISVIVQRDAAEGDQSNHADENVFNYNYDYVISNNSTLDELRNTATTFIDAVRRDGKDAWIY